MTERETLCGTHVVNCHSERLSETHLADRCIEQGSHGNNELVDSVNVNLVPFMEMQRGCVGGHYFHLSKL